MNSIFFSAFALAGAVSAAWAGEVKPAPSASAVTQPSVLEGYRRYEEAPAIAWRRANEEAAVLRGHVGQIRSKPPAQTQDRGAPREGVRGERR